MKHLLVFGSLSAVGGAVVTGTILAPELDQENERRDDLTDDVIEQPHETAIEEIQDEQPDLDDVVEDDDLEDDGTLSKAVWELSNRLFLACQKGQCVDGKTDEEKQSKIAEGVGSREFFSGALVEWGVDDRDGKITATTWKEGRGTAERFQNGQMFSREDRKNFSKVSRFKQLSSQIKEIISEENKGLTEGETPYVFNIDWFTKGFSSHYFLKQGHIIGKPRGRAFGSEYMQYVWLIKEGTR